MKKKQTTIMFYGILIVFIIVVLYLVNAATNIVNEITYDEFMNTIYDKQVEEITLMADSNAGTYRITGKLINYEENESFKLEVPLSDEVMARILDSNESYDFKINTKADSGSGILVLFLINVLPFLLLIGIVYFLISKQMSGASKSMDFGKSRAKLHTDDKKTTFDDVAGLVEEKEEVKEIIDFLKMPKKFEDMGARIPKGVMLVGAPGTGKTLLAKAVAGEANVPFYFISGSDFVELFVGVGASRVRDMFKKAKQTAPCLVFIDEIDAVGRQRGAGLGGGNDEREQTLNQLLTEMDGFGENEGIIVIAATNRPDVLDPALLRPGRFDRQITVSLPDKKGREEILEVHARGKKFDESVKMKYIADRTSGMSGADLENLLNESALLAVRRGKSHITMDEVDEGQDRVLLGPAKRTRKYNKEEKKITAYHESGHVVLGLKLNDASDVQKVTIIPRGRAGGYAMMNPKEEKYMATKQELLQMITGLYGGRAAEEIFFNIFSTGPSDDIKRATKIARSMVTEYGMSDLGPMELEHQEGSVFLGRDYNKTKNFSDKVALEIDTEVRKILDGCYQDAKRIIKENEKLLELIAASLIEHETLTREQIEYLVEHGKMPKEKVTDLDSKSLTELKEVAKAKRIKNYYKMNKEQLIDILKKQ